MVNNIIKMIDSPDDGDRRTGLTILFNQWDELDINDKNKIRASYFSRLTVNKISKNPDEYQHYEDTRSLTQTIEDIEFVAEYVCDDKEKLGYIFLFNIDKIVDDIKFKKLNNER